MRAVLCPVCTGSGIVNKGFYQRTSDTWTSCGGIETCRACSGKGWVEVRECQTIYPYYPPIDPYPYPYQSYPPWHVQPWGSWKDEPPTGIYPYTDWDTDTAIPAFV